MNGIRKFTSILRAFIILIHFNTLFLLTHAREPCRPAALSPWPPRLHERVVYIIMVQCPPGQRGLHSMYEIVHNVGSRSARAPLHAQSTHESAGCDHPCRAAPGSD